VLFPGAAQPRPATAAVLRAAGVEVRHVVTYATEPRPAFDQEVADAPTPRVIVVGSPRAAAALARALESAGRVLPADVAFVAPGATTAEDVARRFGGYGAHTTSMGGAALETAVRALLEEDERA
ncbi:MAG: uroporphyrinogen-III synthase, partial [Planctomycetota bacterium]|nr:uroporphyrinogen-III synthase [Planctomycetota bacterium]